MRKSGPRPSGSGPGAAAGVPPTPTAATATTTTTATTATTTSTLFNLPSISFFSSSHVRPRPDASSAGPATTGGVATFANGATFGDPFSFQPGADDFSSHNTRTRQQQQQQQQQQEQRQQQREEDVQEKNQHQRQRQRPQQSPTSHRGLRRRANSSYSLRDRHGVVASLGIDKYGTATEAAAAAATTTTAAAAAAAAHGGRSNIHNTVVIDSGRPPALPEFALSSAAKLSRDADVFTSSQQPPAAKSSLDIARGYFHTSNARMLGRAATPANGFPQAGGMMVPPPPSGGPQGEYNLVYQHIQDLANKRISTLEYLRKAHEGRVYWFNTLLFDKPDLARMPYFDSRRLARRATNYLLLGLSLPTVIDLNSATPLEFLRSLNLLLTEFDSFQQLHSDTGGTTSTLSRARIPQMFRRATPSSKTRRSSSANNDTLYEGAEGSGGVGGVGAGVGNGAVNGAASMSGPSSSTGGLTVGNGLGGSASVVSFGQCEADLLPGEEYVHLLTPSLPFDPDFFETFATLCDVLVDAYTRLLGLLATPRDCNAAVAELFTKADSRVRKIIVQGIVKEFEDTSRGGVKTEVANVGKVVIGGLM